MDTTKLTPEYLAGFFDGEGSVGHVIRNGRECLQISLSNNYKPILDAVEDKFDGGGVYKDTGSQKYDSRCWKWHCSNNSVMKAFLTFVVPHLTFKQAEVSIALAILQTAHTQGRHQYTEQELLVRMRLFDMLDEAKAVRNRSFEEPQTEVATPIQEKEK